MNDVEKRLSRRALLSFLQEWQALGSIIVVEGKPRPFPATVHYHWSIHDRIGRTDVRIVGGCQQPTGIDLAEHQPFSAAELHLTFRANHQMMRNGQKSGGLVIRHQSTMLGGLYRVRIVPMRGIAAAEDR